MPRTHGYSLKGKRCFGNCDWNAKGRLNVIGALIGSYLLSVSIFEGTINSDVFHAWVEQDLLPKIPQHISKFICVSNKIITIQSVALSTILQ